MIKKYFKRNVFHQSEKSKRNGRNSGSAEAPKLNHEEVSILKRPITSEEIEIVIQTLRGKKAKVQEMGTNGFTAEFYRNRREVLQPIFLKLLKR